MVRIQPDTIVTLVLMLFLLQGTILSVPLAQQIQVPFLATRSVFEIRERPSRMFSFTALVTSQILSEIPWNILGSSLFFFCWVSNDHDFPRV
jgi:ATP-binding cassette, subfamily G (WHITE), member 2, SNQ2